MNTYNWYSKLIKPSWAPSPWVFGPVWTVLYILIAISFGTVFYMLYKGEIVFLIALPFILNLIFNFSFSIFQFRLKNNLLAAVDIILTLITIICAMAAIFPHAQWIAYIQIPYLVWVSITTLLQLNITYLNK